MKFIAMILNSIVNVVAHMCLIAGGIILAFAILSMGGCGERQEVLVTGQDGLNGQGCSIVGSDLVCGDTVFDLDQLQGADGAIGPQGPAGQAGEQGPSGQDGADGQDAANLTTVTLAKGSCSSIYPGIYAQNLSSGYVFDVYTSVSSTCSDYDGGEVCDNVATSFGADNNPPVGNGYPGGGDVCWHGNILLSGARQANGDIKVYILEFNN